MKCPLVTDVAARAWTTAAQGASWKVGGSLGNDGGKELWMEGVFSQLEKEHHAKVLATLLIVGFLLNGSQPLAFYTLPFLHDPQGIDGSLH